MSLITYVLGIYFLFNYTIIKIDVHKKATKYNSKNNYHERLKKTFANFIKKKTNYVTFFKTNKKIKWYSIKHIKKIGY